LISSEQEASSTVPVSPGKHQGTSLGDDILRIVCLGEFRVFRGDVEVRDSDWGKGRGPTRKIKALFAFLLSRRAHGARKETIIDLLWPGQTDSKRANSSFHQALFYLRRALEPELESGSVSSYIRHRDERYYFAPQKPCWIDADVLVDCSERARSLEQSGDPGSAIECWARATELYGGRYMIGIDSKYTDSDYYDWCASACYRFEQLFLAATLTLARHHLDVGHHALAIAHAREALLVEPALEPAHQLLIRCLMEAGRLEHALGQYRVCEAELDFHHERVPSEQTRLLHEELIDRMGSS
jgi:DNA-binding SARP family transcriptional activator